MKYHKWHEDMANFVIQYVILNEDPCDAVQWGCDDDQNNISQQKLLHK